MKKFSIAAIIILLMFPGSTVYARTGSIAVKVTGINVKEGGKVKIGIYDFKEFPVVGKEVDGIGLEVKETSVTYLFKNIPVGKYAIAVFQDVNIDGKLNKNLFGVPKEPYGFSNNKYGMFGPPDFKDVCFEVKEGKPISIEINLK